MASDVKQSWTATRWPCAGAFCAALNAPRLAPEAPYLAALPGLAAIVAALVTLSGLVLAAYYNPWHAFDSVRFIERDVDNGWLVRAYHQTGASVLLGLVYLHLFRSMLARTYRAPGELSWMLSVKLLAVLLLTGWLGFVLAGGAAGYWSLFAATNAGLSLGGLPGNVARWFLGAPPGGGQLARLEVFHALLALCAFLVLAVKFSAARQAPARGDRKVAFFPYYAAQYAVALAVIGLVFSVLLFFAPHFGQSALNDIPGGGLAVPVGLQLPWYLNPVAAIAGVVPSVGGHVWAVIATAAVLYALPWLDRSGANGRAGGLYRALVWLLGLDVVALGISAACPFGSIATLLLAAWFFFHFLVLTPLVTAMEAV